MIDRWKPKLLVKADALRTKPHVIMLPIGLIFLLKAWTSLTLPEFRHEDGRDMFGFYFNAVDVGSILRIYNGYVSFLPNLAAYSFTHLPIPIIYAPYLMTFFSLLVATYAFHLFSTDRYRWIVDSDGTRYLTCLILVLLPLGDQYMIANLTYSQWNLLYILILLLLSSSSGSTSSRILESVVVCLAIVSNPLSIIGIPLCILRFYFFKGKFARSIAVCCVCMILIHQIWGVQHSSFPLDTSIDTLKFSTRVFLSRVIVESFIGTRAVVSILSMDRGMANLCLIGMIVTFLILLSAVYSERRTHNLLIFVTVLGLGWGLVLAPCAARFQDDRGYFLFNPYVQRYVYLPKLLFMSVVLSRFLPYVYRKILQQSPFKKAAVVALFLVYTVVLNAHNRFLYTSSIEEGTRVKTFVRSVYQDIQKARNGEEYQPIHVLDRKEGWSIKINIDNRYANRKE